MFNSTEQPYLIVGSYIDFGIVEREKMIRILPGGNLEVLDSLNRVLPSKPKVATIELALEDTQRFYGQPQRDNNKPR